MQIDASRHWDPWMWGARLQMLGKTMAGVVGTTMGKWHLPYDLALPLATLSYCSSSRSSHGCALSLSDVDLVDWRDSIGGDDSHSRGNRLTEFQYCWHYAKQAQPHQLIMYPVSLVPARGARRDTIYTQKQPNLHHPALSSRPPSSPARPWPSRTPPASRPRAP